HAMRHVVSELDQSPERDAISDTSTLRRREIRIALLARVRSTDAVDTAAREATAAGAAGLRWPNRNRRKFQPALRWTSRGLLRDVSNGIRFALFRCRRDGVLRFILRCFRD